MIKRYLRQLGQLAILNLIIFLLLIFYLKQAGTPAKPTNNHPVIPSITGSISSTQASSALSQPSNQQSSAPADKFTQVPQHNNPGDCWIIISGHIYDVTSYFGSHPGGDGALARYCGQDATVGFETKDKSPGIGHSDSARAMLGQFLIQ